MPIVHIVGQGEYLLQIALLYGFADWHTIWKHPDNAELMRKRKSPNVLFPGDRLVIPDRDTRQESCSTDRRHVFRYRGPAPRLKLVLQGLDGRPAYHVSCLLQVDGTSQQVTSDTEGLVELHIRGDSSSGTIRVEDPAGPYTVEAPLGIGHLDPVGESSGWMARLVNLGFLPPGDYDPSSQEVRAAVEEFQCENGLAVDGVCGSATQSKIESVYGC